MKAGLSFWAYATKTDWIYDCRFCNLKHCKKIKTNKFFLNNKFFYKKENIFLPRQNLADAN